MDNEKSSNVAKPARPPWEFVFLLYGIFFFLGIPLPAWPESTNEGPRPS